MTTQERESLHKLYEVFCGEIYQAQTFRKGRAIPTECRRDDPRLLLLRMHYDLEEIAWKGGDFERARRLCIWISSISHKSNFSLTEDVPMNASALLRHALDEGGGLNCVAKAKILAECCLAFWIPARRVGLYPYSPYDTDNHVVVEIFDRKRRKWIMLDPTSGGYFTDGEKPLSCLEIRRGFAHMDRETVVLSLQRVRNLEALFERNLAWNEYYAKNFFCLCTETVSSFGEQGKSVYLAPKGFDLARTREKNAEYLLACAKRENWGEEEINSLERNFRKMQNFKPLFVSEEAWEKPYEL